MMEFEWKLGLELEAKPSWSAVLSGVAVGLVIPSISAILPIRELLKQQLNIALDYTRSRANAVMIKILNPTKANNITWIIFGILSAGYAFFVYILLPQAMFSLDFGLLLKIFFLILIGMLLGLVLIASNLQFLIEILLTKFLFFWENFAIRILIRKNLIAHRLRNNITTIIYSLSLSFIIL